MNETLIQSLTVMFIGMGTVLAFLCTTIFSMIIMAKIVKKLNEIFPEAVPQTAAASNVTSSVNEEENIAVALLSALLKK